MEITKETKLSDLLSQYPWLKEELSKVNDKFKMLNTPMGKIMMGKATIAEMSKKSGMDADAMNEQLEKADLKQIEMGRSIGIMNVNARIKNVYGNNYGIRYESDHETGTKAIIILPTVKMVTGID